jgi:TPR repeat protein
MGKARRPLVGLILAVSLAAGMPACSNDAAADLEAARVLAEQGDAAARALLGEAYYFGDGVVQDYREAFRWSRLAAGQGNALGQALVGEAHYFGNGAAQDYGEAVGWARLAAEQGNPIGQARLGTAYYDGNGVSQDHREGVRWARLVSCVNGS